MIENGSACGSGYPGHPLDAPASPADETHRLEGRYGERGRLEVPADRARPAGLLAGATAGLTYCGVLLSTGSPGVIVFVVLAACFPLAAAATAIRCLLTGRPAVCIDRDGITSGRQRILWPDVGAVTTRSSGRAQVVCVGRTGEAERRYRAQLSRFRRAIEPADRQVFHAITIYLPRRTKLDAEHFAHWLRQIRDSRNSSPLAQSLRPPDPD